ncbi:MAG: hypothetical protein ABSF24_10145 [Candidatus Bathyarchaeia archaeon]|jgi:hypothetical protein
MVELPNWEKIVVPQRHGTGCVPTGYEWMLRYLGTKGVNFDTFQEDFDLQYSGEGKNNFQDVARKVKTTYPDVNISIKSFDIGKEKLEFIATLVSNAVPCLLSVAKTPVGGDWHIVPVVSIDDTSVKVIWTGNQTTMFAKTEIIHRHDNWPGGKDIAWIER